MGILQKMSLRFLMIIGIGCAGLLFYMIHWKYYTGYDFPAELALVPTAVFLLILLGIRWFLLKMESSKKKEKMLLLSIFMLGLVLRFAWVIYVPIEQAYDYAMTWRVAGQIANGNWHAFAFGEFLYKFPHWSFPAIFYAVLHKLGSGNILVVKLVNGSLWAIECYLIYGISKEITKTGALMAIFLAALNPTSIFYAATLDPQNLAIPFFWGAVFIYAKVFNQKIKVWALAFAGMLLGLGNLFRPLSMIFFLAISIHALFFLKTGKQLPRELPPPEKEKPRIWRSLLEGKGCALAMMLAMMLLLPVLINQPFVQARIFQRKSTDMGTWLLYLNAGMNDESNGLYNLEDATIWESVNYDLDKANEIAKKKLLERISNKKQLAALFYRKFGVQWGLSTCYSTPWTIPVEKEKEDSKVWEGLRRTLPTIFMIGQSIYGVTVLIILVNLLTNIWVLNPRIAIPLLCWLGVIGLHLLIETQPCYGHIAIPGIMLLGSGFSWPFQKVRFSLSKKGT